MNKRRNQLIAIITLIVGLVFLYQPDYILLKGIAFPLLVLSAILSGIFFSNKRIIEVIAGLGLIAGLASLYLPIFPTLQSSAFNLLFASAIAFGITTNLKRSMPIVAVIIVIIGLAFLYYPYFFLFTVELPDKFDSLNALEDVIGSEGQNIKQQLFQISRFLHRTALSLMLTGLMVLAIVSPRKLLIERISISVIALGLVFLCQPFWILLYQTGFQILLGGLTAFIVVAHR